MTNRSKDEVEQHDREIALQRSVDLLFAQYVQIENADALRTISEYYGYLANSIDHKRYRIDASQPLLEPFEAVSLVLRDRIKAYPESIKAQIEEVFKEAHLLRTFALIANLPADDLRRIKSEQQLAPYMRAISSIIRTFEISSEHYGLSRKLLFDAKLGLKRISQILRFAVTLEVQDYEAAFQDVKSHYDPDLINKNKILALFHILKVEVTELDDERNKRCLMTKLESIETELGKPKPKWGVIIMSFFVLFGFLADLKTLSPATYEKSYRIVSQIISIIHTEGSVSAAKRSAPQLPEPPSDATLPPSSFGVKPKQDDNNRD